MAGLRAPQGKRHSGAGRPAPRHEGRFLWGFAPCPDREPLYMGLRPKPHSRTFLPKSPRDPKKTNWIRYILSSIDSEQGCRRQPCFLFGADSTAPRPPLRPDAPRARRATPHPPHAAQRPTRPSFIPRSQSCRPSSRPRRAPPSLARLLAEVWKPQTFSFYQSISNLDVSLPNVSKKDVKGLLFRK